MENKKINHDYKFFFYLSLFFVIIAWGLFLLAIFNLFYWWSISLFIALVTAWGAKFTLNNLTKLSQAFIIVNISIILVTSLFITFSSPSVFSGRDQGSISQAAIRLAQNGTLKFSTPASKDFFDINITQKDRLKNCLIDNLDDFQNNSSLKFKVFYTYCQAKTSAKAFNFPGFYYTADGNLITQFPIAYIAWLAFFYSFFGIFGLKIANGILLYLFFISIYLIVNKLSDSENYKLQTRIFIAISSLIIIFTSFCFMWFSKFTLTENLALPLLWSGILGLIFISDEKIKNLRNKKAILILIFLSLSLLIFARIEGIVFFFIAFPFLILNKNTKNYFRKNFLKIFLIPLSFLAIIFIWNLNVDIYFYKSILKASLENIQENATDISKNNSLLLILNLFKTFTLYGLMMPLLFGLAGIFYLTQKKSYKKLLPLLIVFPTIFYILSPQITMEHPWMLRRFTFSILPLFLIYSLILISKLYAKKNIFLGLFLTFLIFSFNLPAFIKYLIVIPNQNLFEKTQELSQNFSKQDLLLVDQLASGNNFEMIADPLSSIFDKNAVYFFNVEDLSKIDLNKYEKIYLLIPKSKENYYKNTLLKENMFFVKEYSLEFKTINSKRDSSSFPEIKNEKVEGLIFEIIY